jgi:hypothetical protein
MLLHPCLQALAFGGGLGATISGGTFSDIDADMGVMVLANSRLYVTDTIFEKNRLAKGALYVSWLGSLFALGNVTLSGNTAKEEGPALYIVNGTAVVYNSNFSGNTAQRGGGAVHVKAGSHLELVNSNFTDNAAGKTTEAYGGAVNVMDSQVSIINCTFTNNMATQGAGAIYVGMATPPNATDRCRYGDLQRWLTMKVSRFEGNIAPTGGALAVYNAAVSIDNSTFTSKMARPVQIASMQLRGVLQSAGYYTLGVGGAVYADNAVVDIQGSFFTSNVAVMDGGERDWWWTH